MQQRMPKFCVDCGANLAGAQIRCPVCGAAIEPLMSGDDVSSTESTPEAMSRYTPGDGILFLAIIAIALIFGFRSDAGAGFLIVGSVFRLVFVGYAISLAREKPLGQAIAQVVLTIVLLFLPLFLPIIAA